MTHTEETWCGDGNPQGVNISVDPSCLARFVHRETRLPARDETSQNPAPNQYSQSQLDVLDEETVSGVESFGVSVSGLLITVEGGIGVDFRCFRTVQSRV